MFPVCSAFTSGACVAFADLVPFLLLLPLFLLFIFSRSLSARSVCDLFSCFLFLYMSYVALMHISPVIPPRAANGRRFLFGISFSAFPFRHFPLRLFSCVHTACRDMISHHRMDGLSVLLPPPVFPVSLSFFIRFPHRRMACIPAIFCLGVLLSSASLRSYIARLLSDFFCFVYKTCFSC